MTRELQSTLEGSGIESPALRNLIACMAHVIRIALGAFLCSLGVKGRTKSWEAHECDQQFGENESNDIGKSERFRKEGNAGINKVSAMSPGLAEIIEKVYISTYFESPETDPYTADNASYIDYTDTWSSKWVDWLSKSQRMYRGTTYCGCEDIMEFDTGVVSACLPITRIEPPVSQKSKILWLLATLNNTGWVEYRQVHHGSVEAILVLDGVDVEKTYGDSVLCCHIEQRILRWYGWRYVSFGPAEDSMEGRLILRCEVCAPEAVQIVYWSYSYDG